MLSSPGSAPTEGPQSGTRRVNARLACSSRLTGSAEPKTGLLREEECKECHARSHCGCHLRSWCALIKDCLCFVRVDPRVRH